MAVQYTVQISDADYKALCFHAANPHAYVDEKVTEYITLMKNDLVKQIIKTELAKPGTRTIPADKEELLRRATVKSAKQMQAEDTARMLAMVQNPDAFDGNIGDPIVLP